MSLYWTLIIGMFLAVLSSVVIVVISDNYGDRNKFFKFISDFLNCKIMAAEIILKAIYIVSSFSFFAIGIVFILYWNVHPQLRLLGIFFIMIGVLGTRVVYELFLSFLRHTKNTEEIKLKLQDKEEKK